MKAKKPPLTREQRRERKRLRYLRQRDSERGTMAALRRRVAELENELRITRRNLASVVNAAKAADQWKVLEATAA